jgi:hypothetical protein
MRILQVANFDYKKNYHQFYNCDYKFYFGLLKNGHAVYQFSNRDLARQEGFFKSRFASENAINKKLIKTVNQLKPDLIFLGHAENIQNETLLEIKSQHKNIKIAGFYVDALWLPKNVEYLKYRATALDALFITTAGDSLNQFKSLCPIVEFIANPVDDSIEIYKQFEKDNTEHDVFFAGSGVYRTETCEYLRENLKDIKFNILGQRTIPLTYGNKYFEELTKCKIGLNLPQFTDDIFQPYLYSSDRISHYFGNGLLTILHAKTGYKDFFKENEEAIYYSELEELAEKIQFYSKNDSSRKLIAKNGWTKYHMLYNSKIITQYIVNSL